MRLHICNRCGQKRQRCYHGGFKVLRWTVQKISRIVAQLTAAVRSRNRTLQQRAGGSQSNDLLPPGVSWVVVVRVAQGYMLPIDGRWVSRFVNKAHLHRGKAAGARRKDHSARNQAQRHLFAIDFKNETVSQLHAAGSHIVDNRRRIRIHRGRRNIPLLQLLISRNLRQIDEVSDHDFVVAQIDPGIVVDAEIAHRMGRGQTTKANQEEQCRGVSRNF